MAEGYLQARSPLNARLDVKSFVQLTVWVVLILGALGLGRMAYARIANTAGKVVGKATNSGVQDIFA